MEDEYGSWLTEDLEEHYDYLKKQRDRGEMYSDRAEINQILKLILSEMQSRERK